ncbi:MAG TPA: hypothetical protein VMW24_22065 [Sedimentisphaerales bacterium]|nr:hypothetical protein [Sedimentisphaerales bacterium]
MNEIQAGPNDLLDTTDSLEAVGVFKGWKNFFFIIIVLCLVLLQVSFWLVDRGYIQVSPSAEAAEPVGEGEFTAPEIKVLEIPVEQELAPTVPAAVEPAEPLQQTKPVPSEVEETAEPEPAALGTPDQEPDKTTAEPNQVIEPNRPADPNLTSRTTRGEKAGTKLQRAITWPSADFLSGVTAEQFAWMVRLANAVLVLTASLYCLTLMFSLKVSMHGRLGGINHISRAFFLSLLMLVLLLPWQMVFGGVVTGAVYTPAELMSWHAAEKTGDTLAMALYYLRFSGYGVLIFLLLLLSQYRSLRWAKAILRRLEII